MLQLLIQSQCVLWLFKKESHESFHIMDEIFGKSAKVSHQSRFCNLKTTACKGCITLRIIEFNTPFPIWLRVLWAKSCSKFKRNGPGNTRNCLPRGQNSAISVLFAFCNNRWMLSVILHSKTTVLLLTKLECHTSFNVLVTGLFHCTATPLPKFVTTRKDLVHQCSNFWG